MKVKKVVLVIGGSDPSGGAGIQADIKTAVRLGLYPCSAVTALTAQNGKTVTGIWPVEKDILRSQLDAVFSDFTPAAVKVGLLTSEEGIRCVASCLEEFEAQNIVVDPVITPTLSSGDKRDSLYPVLAEFLFPLATLVTPNIPEKDLIESSTGQPLESLCSAFLLKGGHSKGEFVEDTLFYRSHVAPGHPAPSSAFPTLNFNHSSAFIQDSILPPPEEEIHWVSKTFRHKRISTGNTHGSGCVLSSAIASFLAEGYDLEHAVEKAIKFLHDAMRDSSIWKPNEGPYGPVLI